MGSAKEIATVPSVAHLGGVGVVNLAHRIHRNHVSRSDGTGKQCDPPDLWEDIGCSVGLDAPTTSLWIYFIYFISTYLNPLRLVCRWLMVTWQGHQPGLWTMTPQSIVTDLGPASWRGWFTGWLRKWTQAALAVSHARGGWNHNVGGSRGTAQDAPKNKHKQTTLSLCGFSMKRSINDWKQRKRKKNKQLKKIARSQVERREAGTR